LRGISGAPAAGCGGPLFRDGQFEKSCSKIYSNSGLAGSEGHGMASQSAKAFSRVSRRWGDSVWAVRSCERPIPRAVNGGGDGFPGFRAASSWAIFGPPYGRSAAQAAWIAFPKIGAGVAGDESPACRAWRRAQRRTNAGPSASSRLARTALRMTEQPFERGFAAWIVFSKDRHVFGATQAAWIVFSKDRHVFGAAQATPRTKTCPHPSEQGIARRDPGFRGGPEKSHPCYKAQCLGVGAVLPADGMVMGRPPRSPKARDRGHRQMIETSIGIRINRRSFGLFGAGRAKLRSG
jgi:hypothetical protein